MKHVSNLFFSLLFVATAFSVESFAASGPIVNAPHSTVQLIAGHGYIGVDIKLEPGWKTYWRSPGDAGLPPEFTMEKADNINVYEQVLPRWPIPERFSLFGIDTFGYEKRVTFTLEYHRNTEKPSHLSMLVKYLICSDICIPAEAMVEIDLPAGEAENADLDKILEHFLLNYDRGITISSASIQGDTVTVVANATTPLENPDIILEAKSGEIIFFAPEIDVSGNTYTFTSKMEIPDGVIPPKKITATVIGKDRAYEHDFSTHIPRPTSVSKSIAYLAFYLIFAFIGGLILNVMPCVLPVLSLKLMTVMNHQDNVRQEFLWTVLGILTSFMGLAALVAGSKIFGHTLGWGVQFQSPWFLGFMAVVILIFALNLFGVFQIKLPQFLGDVATKQSGHFATGLFATLLATPCTAPFLGTAIAWGFSQGTGIIFLTFFAIGLGFALPYLLVVAFPSLVRFLPKPGRWMNWVKYIMGGFLLATAFWLLSIIFFPSGNGDIKDDLWQPFEPEKIEQYVADGKIVFVDITADWCITCKFNKITVLDKPMFRKIVLGHDKVVAMRGDWTRPNDEISEFLTRMGRAGIPFNAVFSLREPEGFIFSEILDEHSLIKFFL